MIVPKHANVKTNKNTADNPVLVLFVGHDWNPILPIIEMMKRYIWLAFENTQAVPIGRTLYPFP